MTRPFLVELVEELRPIIEAGGYDAPAIAVGPPPSLRKAIANAAPRALVVEYKRAAPGGSASPLPQYRIDEFLDRIRGARVAALSCLTVPPHFQGSPSDLRELAARDRRPVLFKDFVIDPRQVDCAARIGASAILLLASLPRAGIEVPLAELADRAHAKGLEVLLELHAPEERVWIDRVPADLIGVNVRNLNTLEIDRPTASATLEGLPHRIPVIGLSGVTGPESAEWFWRRGADAILVGSGVARSEDPLRFLTSLRGGSEVGPR
ncbi:MAG: beta/alpha barrel domain-containing protein [Thermoplasmata archaeon]